MLPKHPPSKRQLPGFEEKDFKWRMASRRSLFFTTFGMNKV